MQLMRSLIPLLAGAACAGAHAAPIQMLTNGSFETGTLSGWTATTQGTGTCPSQGRDWNVSTTGSATGCSNVGAPVDGKYAAYVMNDGGAAPMYYRLSQTFTLSPGALTSANLSFKFTSVSSYSGNARTFYVDVLNGATLLGTPYTYTIPFSDGDPTWSMVSLDLTSLLATHTGTQLTVRFNNYIPSNWTGPAGLGLDAVSLMADVSAVPEPGSIALLGLAFAGLAGMSRRKAR